MDVKAKKEVFELPSGVAIGYGRRTFRGVMPKAVAEKALTDEQRKEFTKEVKAAQKAAKVEAEKKKE